MMNLQEFITQTINQIIDGVAKSQEHAMEAGAFVNVPVNINRNLGESYYINYQSLPQPQIIEFDIGVTTTETQEIKGGMGIFVASLGIGYQAGKGSSGTELSRIKFSIPVILTSQNQPDGNIK